MGTANFRVHSGVYNTADAMSSKYRWLPPPFTGYTMGTRLFTIPLAGTRSAAITRPLMAEERSKTSWFRHYSEMASRA